MKTKQKDDKRNAYLQRNLIFEEKFIFRCKLLSFIKLKINVNSTFYVFALLSSPLLRTNFKSRECVAYTNTCIQNVITTTSALRRRERGRRRKRRELIKYFFAFFYLIINGFTFNLQERRECINLMLSPLSSPPVPSFCFKFTSHQLNTRSFLDFGEKSCSKFAL